MKCAGIDGFRHGWVVASRSASGDVTISEFKHFAQVLDSPFELVAVDIPIGISEGRRPCDADAKRLLGKRHVCVFYAPPRAALQVPYEEAKTIGRSLGVGAPTKQCWGIVPKINEVDGVMTPSLQTRIYEVHPEVTFREMNGGTPVPTQKATVPGQEIRRQILARHLGFDPADLAMPSNRPRGAHIDDVYDALAALWSAERIAAGTALTVSPGHDPDPHGLSMNIWF